MTKNFVYKLLIKVTYLANSFVANAQQYAEKNLNKMANPFNKT